MTVLTWPTPSRPTRVKKSRKMIIDPLPEPILHLMVSDIPGPADETEIEHSARFQRQLAEVMAYKPRSAAEAMMAIQCVVIRLLQIDSLRDAARTDVSPDLKQKNLKLALRFEKQNRDMEKMLAQWQNQPVGRLRPDLFEAFGVKPYLIPDPDAPEEPDEGEEAVSAIIVPLHPAPKMLQ